MSAITPLPPASPVRPVPAPRSPLLYLVADPWIAISWLVLICTGTPAALLRLVARHPAPPSVLDVVAVFLITGYIFWSAYFGLAACWRLAFSMLRGTASVWIAIAFSMLPPGWVTFLVALLYAWLGGGVYQFARRWWLLAHGQQPSFLTA